MSLLAPFYFFGALAVGLPILFHMIRRRPKGEVEFSSLMFLRPTPPRLTRKSRLDNWPLLLIRALALTLLAFAFARPFLRSASLLDADLVARRMILVMDTSASMQRPGVWQQAIDKANDLISDLNRGDQFAIVTFDSQPKTLLSFEESGELTLPQLKETATSRLKSTTPTWNHTDTGRAISYAADLAVAFEPEDESETEDPAEPRSTANITGPTHMILVSDMQVGSQIESLQVYAWPDEMRLDIETVTPREKTNAAAEMLATVPGDPIQESDKNRVRVRVTNSADATESKFRLKWSNEAGNDASELPVQVPPGESRVVRMPAPTPGITSLVLSGDDQSFDNVRYLVSPQPQALTLLHLGTAASKPRESLLYYLQRVPLNNERRTVSIKSLSPDAFAETPEAKKVPLLVMEEPLSSDASARVQHYVQAGGRALMVLPNQERLADMATVLNGLIESESSVRIEQATVDDYAMFSQIDFSHPIFASMADPQFNDFTKIRIWSHRKVTGLDDQWRVLSQFDDGDPALMERTIGDGRLFILATGWQPQQSQLALSTKFIPLVFSLFDSGGGKGVGDRYTVGQAIDFEPSSTATITGPSGSAFKFDRAAESENIDQPGIYQFADGDNQRTFAVNLSESESRTETLASTELERFGVTLGKQLTTAQSQAKQRQLRDVELEGRQKLWQLALVVALVLLGLETLLGGLISRGRREAAGSQS